ncbi:DUF2059 domain-containing protein [Microbulbifer sp. SAOS-129_SWC]|uniref:DUF2059 domain-containing protein n=1 Tax=Microbulbifer sp. SAOS-129_SWC TaxID=3145235 RepID=UPI0032164FBD
MKKLLSILSITLFCQMASAATPSDASIQELLEVSQSKQLLERSMSQVDDMMQKTMQQQMAGKQVSAADQKVIDKMSKDMVTLIKSEMSWDNMAPVFIDVYQQSLTQEEVDGMLDFYHSKAGKALVAKMPVIMQKTMQLMQQKVMQMQPKIQKIQQVALAEIKKNNKAE